LIDERPTIALVGPAYPYRGGIAQYTTQLHRSLSRAGEVLTISFEKLYPPFLYPGTSDIEVGAEDAAEPGVEYVIHTYRPWSLNEVARRITAIAPDVVLLTWWTLFWQPGFAYLAWLLHRRGITVLYICHNVVDHDATGVKEAISRFLLRFVDGYIVHSSGDEQKLLSYYEKPILNTKVLPVFDQYKPSRQEITKRGRLEILFFGIIRPYKGLEDLVEALAILDDADVYLTIVGEPWIDPTELSARLESSAAPNVEADLRFVSDADAAFYFGRADVVAIPYRQSTASAVASLAFNYRKPVLATRVEGIKDLVAEGQTGWLVEPRSPGAIAATLAEITRADAERMAPSIERFCEEHSWDSLSEQIIRFARDNRA